MSTRLSRPRRVPEGAHGAAGRGVPHTCPFGPLSRPAPPRGVSMSLAGLSPGHARARITPSRGHARCSPMSAHGSTTRPQNFSGGRGPLRPCLVGRQPGNGPPRQPGRHPTTAGAVTARNGGGEALVRSTHFGGRSSDEVPRARWRHRLARCAARRRDERAAVCPGVRY